MELTRLRLALMAIALSAAGPACREAYEPGLGELMTLTQMRHTKLWYAGQQRNWPLAEYELGELKEGFDDVLRLHPTVERSPLPLSTLLPKMMEQPLADLGKAVRSRDATAFDTAYDAVTAGCNACHRAANFGFNVVRRPSAEWFGDQDFVPGPS